MLGRKAFRKEREKKSTQIVMKNSMLRQKSFLIHRSRAVIESDEKYQVTVIGGCFRV
jgi:hypothetical protein